MTVALLDDATELEPEFELVSFVRRQVRNARLHLKKERRSDEREELVLPVTVQPVDGDFKPIAPRFAAVARDISPKGIGLVCSSPKTFELLSLRFTMKGETVNVVMRTIWQRHQGPFDYIGGEFVARLNADPQGHACGRHPACHPTADNCHVVHDPNSDFGNVGMQC